MLDGGHIAWLIILGSDDPGLVLEVPLVLEVNVLAVSVRQSSSQRVQYRSSGTDVPLLDHGGMDINILMSSYQLPNL